MAYRNYNYKFISILLVFLTSYTNSYSKDNTLVRQDRVWELKSMFRDWIDAEEYLGNYVYISSFNKFGNPELLDAHTYYPVLNYKKVYYRADNSYIELSDNLKLIQARLREENGKVYMHIDRNMTLTPLTHDFDNLYTGLKEGLLFDIEALPGEKYIGLSLEKHPGWYDDYAYGFNYSLIEYMVEKVESIQINGESRRLQTVIALKPGHDYGNCKRINILEGVGIVRNGGMFYSETYLGVADISYSNEFVRYFDNEGNILYGSEYNDDDPEEIKLATLECFHNESCQSSSQMHFFNLQGMKVDQPKKGDILICTDGVKSQKIIFQ